MIRAGAFCVFMVNGRHARTRKKIQLEIWLAKPPEERIRLTLQMNDELFTLWDEVKKNMADSEQPDS